MAVNTNRIRQTSALLHVSSPILKQTVIKAHGVFYLLDLDVFPVCVRLGYIAGTADNRFNPRSGELAAVGAVVRSQARRRAA
jgi:hypothetical protein